MAAAAADCTSLGALGCLGAGEAAAAIGIPIAAALAALCAAFLLAARRRKRRGTGKARSVALAASSARPLPAAKGAPGSSERSTRVRRAAPAAALASPTLEDVVHRADPTRPRSTTNPLLRSALDPAEEGAAASAAAPAGRTPRLALPARRASAPFPPSPAPSAAHRDVSVRDNPLRATRAARLVPEPSPRAGGVVVAQVSGGRSSWLMEAATEPVSPLASLTAASSFASPLAEYLGSPSPTTGSRATATLSSSRESPLARRAGAASRPHADAASPPSRSALLASAPSLAETAEPALVVVANPLATRRLERSADADGAAASSRPSRLRDVPGAPAAARSPAPVPAPALVPLAPSDPEPASPSLSVSSLPASQVHGEPHASRTLNADAATARGEAAGRSSPRTGTRARGGASAPAARATALPLSSAAARAVAAAFPRAHSARATLVPPTDGLVSSGDAARQR
jgi:hypothetical protein